VTQEAETVPYDCNPGIPEAMSESPKLLPAESVALTVALAQVLEGRHVAPNTAGVCVLALARLTGRHDWTLDD